jgi:hypothetical protein
MSSRDRLLLSDRNFIYLGDELYWLFDLSNAALLGKLLSSMMKAPVLVVRFVFGRGVSGLDVNPVSWLSGVFFSSSYAL